MHLKGYRAHALEDFYLERMVPCIVLGSPFTVVNKWEYALTNLRSNRTLQFHSLRFAIFPSSSCSA